MRDECLICHAPLEYLENEELMECAICHRQEYSRTRCVNGHYVCNECHMQGLDQVVEICYHLNSSDPLEILEAMMALPQIHMHGPEHHILVGAALLTAYYHAGGMSIFKQRFRRYFLEASRFLAGHVAFGALADQPSAQGCLSPSSHMPHHFLNDLISRPMR